MVFLRGRSGAHPAKCDIPYSRREKYSSWKMLNVQSGEWLSESRFPGIFLGGAMRDGQRIHIVFRA